MAERVLVTGATGFLGSRLVPLLRERGAEVVVLRRSTSDAGKLGGGWREVVGELGDRATLERALQGCAAVYHLAACTSLLDRDREAREAVNVEGTRHLLAAMGSVAPNARLVYCSSVAAVGLSDGPEVLDEKSPFNCEHIHYCDTKRRAERLVLAAAGKGFDALVVNPATLIGPGMKQTQRDVLSKVAAGRQLFYPPGGSSFTPVDDAARGLVLAREKGRAGERYILAGDNSTFKDYFAAIAELAGARPPRLPLPAALLPAAGYALEAFCGVMGRDTGRFAAAFGWYSSEKAARELGYAKTPLGRALAELLRPHMEN